MEQTWYDKYFKKEIFENKSYDSFLELFDKNAYGEGIKPHQNLIKKNDLNFISSLIANSYALLSWKRLIDYYMSNGIKIKIIGANSLLNIFDD